MIGLIVLGLLVAWLVASRAIARSIVGKTSFRGAPLPYPLVLPIVLALPFADEIVGRSQFFYLCHTEAKVFVAPNVRSVKAAREGRGYSGAPLTGYAIPVTEQSRSYIDIATGKTFYSYKAFHTPGGFVMRAGLNLGNSTSCWPEKWWSGAQGFDLDALLKKGKE